MKRKIAALISLSLMLFTAIPGTVAASDTEEYVETMTAPIQSADAVFTEFEVLRDNGYTVNMYHAYQGPLCDAAFAKAQGNNMLVTDYFNVSINNNLRIYEIASDIQLRVKVPVDLVQKGRTWWMICISRYGTDYIFEDEDDDDETITFTANRFYAYAMCYTDEEQEEKVVKEEVIEVVDENPRSRLHTINDSQTISGQAKEDLSALNTADVSPAIFYGTKTNRMPQMRSEMTDAMILQKRAGKMQVIYFTM